MGFSLLCFIVFGVSVILADGNDKKSHEDSFFVTCDSNKNLMIDKHEWIECAKSKEYKGSNVDSIFPSEEDNIFDLLDKNHDKNISVKEYREFQDSLLQSKDGSEYVHVTLKDGTRKKLSKDDLQRNIQDRMKGFQKTKGNNIIREEKETATLSNIEKDNPGLSRILKVGNWSYYSLRSLNYIDGKLARIQSIDAKSLSSSTAFDIDKHIASLKQNPAKGESNDIFLELTVISSKEKELYKVFIMS
jgi:hypothetical protein